MSAPKAGENFTNWYNRQGFRNFDASEFTNYFKVRRRGVTNSTPDCKLWANIIATLRVVDDLRDYFGKPVTILSSYRSPAYNAAINGAASRSYHMQFLALDISVAGQSPSSVFSLLKEWRDSGKFKGGLGKYNTFTHIDTRGYNATW